MKHYIPWPVFLIINCLLLFIGGCADSSQPGTAAGSAERNVTEPAERTSEEPPLSGVTAVPEITVSVADIDAYNAVIKQHAGKVVLVDFWATWCPPCVAQFPHTVELSRKYKDKGFAVVSVSGDDPGQSEDVLGFLKQHDATFDNLISQYGVGSETAEQFNIVGGAIPFYKLYDREGQLRYQFGGFPEDGVEPYGTIEQRVRELIAEGETGELKDL